MRLIVMAHGAVPFPIVLAEHADGDRVRQRPQRGVGARAQIDYQTGEAGQRSGPGMYYPWFSMCLDFDMWDIAALRTPCTQTIRKHADGIIAAIDRSLSNGRQEG